MLQHWFREVRHEPRHRKRQVQTSQLDTYLLEMVSFQIIKERGVQLAVAATAHRLWEEGGRAVGQGYQKGESNALCSPAASQQDRRHQRSLKGALCSLPLLIIAPLSALCSGGVISSPTHSCVSLCFPHPAAFPSVFPEK